MFVGRLGPVSPDGAGAAGGGWLNWRVRAGRASIPRSAEAHFRVAVVREGGAWPPAAAKPAAPVAAR